ncbi:MAG: nucleotide exchange factor GrpE [Parvularculaceae bacterium]
MAGEAKPDASVENKAAAEAAVQLTEEDRADAASEVEALRAQVSELNDRVLRFAAELENTRRRGEREKADASRYAIAAFARDLLNVADAFDRALAAAPEESAPVAPEIFSAFVAGLRITDNELHTVLERHGVKRIDPKGEKFDPNLHQAVAQAPGDAPAGHVLDVVQPGFIIGDRVLRAAMVVVSTGAAASSSSGGAAPGAPGSRVDTSA